jgi:hypothetical protein
MAGIRRMRGAGALGLAMTMWDVWKRIPPQHRKRLIKQARKHGPKIASRIVQANAERRQRRSTR